MKRWGFLALLILLCAMVPASLAEEEPQMFTSGDFQYILLPDGGAEITDYAGKAAQLTVPAQLDGYAVVSIGEDAFYSCDSLTSISLPEGLQSIGDYAFYFCDSLTTITLPEGLQSIGDGAFSSCRSLASIILPEGLQTIGGCAFSSCGSLTTVILPDSIREMVANPFDGCDKLTKIQVSPEHPYLATIQGVLFSKPDKRLICYPVSLKAASYSVPQGIKIIGDYAFSRCSSLTTITLPEGLQRIGEAAFYGCYSLATITLPEGLQSIGYSAFYGCSSLVSITLPEGVQSIGEDAFLRCPNLELTVVRDSYAHRWAKENGCTYIFTDSYDWLLK